MNTAENIVPLIRPLAGPDPQQGDRADDMLAVIHDFRQPLSTIQLSADRLAVTMASSDAGGHAEIQRIRRAVKTLTRMTSDLLDASAIDTKRLTLKRVAVRIAALATETVACVRDLPARCEIHVDSDADVVVVADPGRVVQVIANLLGNAVKYGEPETPIALDVTRTADDVRISVSNRGAGIPAKELPRVFERFYRADDVRERQTGLGLGLTIAKGIIEAHGGRIWASSLPNVITQFTFTLPLGAGR